MRLKLILVLIVFVGCFVMSGQISAQSADSSVYLDSFFGGKENGALIARNASAKKITLDISQKLKQQLGGKNIGTILSRDRDEFVTLDRRVMMAKSHGANVYMAITVSKAKKDCIRLYYPRQTQSEPSKEKQNLKELGGAIDALILEERAKKSGQLAEAIYGSIKQRLIPVCVEKQMWVAARNYDINYVVENAHSPVVIVDFGVSDTAAPYVLNSALMENIVSAFSEGLGEYFAALPRQSHK